MRYISVQFYNILLLINKHVGLRHLHVWYCYFCNIKYYVIIRYFGINILSVVLTFRFQQSLIDQKLAIKINRNCFNVFIIGASKSAAGSRYQFIVSTSWLITRDLVTFSETRWQTFTHHTRIVSRLEHFAVKGCTPIKISATT